MLREGGPGRGRGARWGAGLLSLSCHYVGSWVRYLRPSCAAASWHGCEGGGVVLGGYPWCQAGEGRGAGAHCGSQLSSSPRWPNGAGASVRVQMSSSNSWAFVLSQHCPERCWGRDPGRPRGARCSPSSFLVVWGLGGLCWAPAFPSPNPRSDLLLEVAFVLRSCLTPLGQASSECIVRSVSESDSFSKH